MIVFYLSVLSRLPWAPLQFTVGTVIILPGFPRTQFEINQYHFRFTTCQAICLEWHVLSTFPKNKPSDRVQGPDCPIRAESGSKEKICDAYKSAGGYDLIDLPVQLWILGNSLLNGLHRVSELVGGVAEVGAEWEHYHSNHISCQNISRVIESEEQNVLCNDALNIIEDFFLARFKVTSYRLGSGSLGVTLSY